MREILFRGKQKDTKEWVYGNLFRLLGNSYICYGTTNYIPDLIEIIPETVGEYTGLTDKNGRKIFEGDIVKYSVNTVGIINYATACFCVHDIKNRNNPAMDIVFEAFPNGIEVIGNIYDNPELLEVKQNG